MLISQTGLTYFYKWPISCEIKILNLIKCGCGICNRFDQTLLLLTSCFFCLARDSGTRVGLTIKSYQEIVWNCLSYRHNLCFIFLLVFLCRQFLYIVGQTTTSSVEIRHEPLIRFFIGMKLIIGNIQADQLSADNINMYPHKMVFFLFLSFYK